MCLKKNEENKQLLLLGTFRRKDIKAIQSSLSGVNDKHKSCKIWFTRDHSKTGQVIICHNGLRSCKQI